MYPSPPPSPTYDQQHTHQQQQQQQQQQHQEDVNLVGRIIGQTLRIDNILGVGAYGVVYTATNLLDGTQCAVKTLKKHSLDAKQKKLQDQEIQLHYDAQGHPNVLSMLTVEEDLDYRYVVLEYCPEGDLFTNITDRGHYVRNDALARDIFLQILDAVEHCHQRGIYHRDLKPENILVKENGRQVKLADFGLATRSAATSDFGCGSTFYMSPECQESYPMQYATYKSAPNDVWSLGVILVNLTCGRNPWKRACFEDSTYSAYIKDRSFLKSILPITDELNVILCNIFEPDPQKRINLATLRHIIQQCPGFTSLPAHVLPSSRIRPNLPISPPLSPYDCPTQVYVTQVRLNSPPLSPPQSPTSTCASSSTSTWSVNAPAYTPTTSLPQPSPQQQLGNKWTSSGYYNPTVPYTHALAPSQVQTTVASAAPIVAAAAAPVHVLPIYAPAPVAPAKVFFHHQSEYVSLPEQHHWLLPQQFLRVAMPFLQHMSPPQHVL